MRIQKINSFELEQYRKNSKVNNNTKEKPLKLLSANSITFGSIFSSRKKIPNIIKFIKNDNLKSLKAFSQLDKFIKENKLIIIMDSSRKKYKAKPYYMVQLENAFVYDTSVHGYGNTKEDAICNMIMILSEWKKRGLSAHNYQQAPFDIPKFDLFELFQINFHQRMQFEKFKNK